jgi:hypothetical protein
MAATPMDKTSVASQGAGLGGGDGGAFVCPLTQTNCTVSAACDLPLGDAGSNHISETATINADGSISGTVSYSFSIMGVMIACAFDFTATKQ